MMIDGVKVPAPEVHLEGLADRTRERTIRIDGRVDPYFDDLRVQIVQKGKAAKSLQLIVDKGGSTAKFSQEVVLVHGDNPLTFKAFYKTDLLGASRSARAIFSDQQLPRLTQPLRFDAAGDYLYVTLEPSEDLSLVRVMQAVGRSQSGVWKKVDQNAETGFYSFPATVPTRSVTFWVELTDIAGNTATVSEYYRFKREEVAGAGFTPLSLQGGGPLVSDGQGGISGVDSGEGFPRRLAEGVTLISSRFIEELAMEFVPFGQQRLEMSRYEVPERAWFQFLRETGRGNFGGGRVTLPMVLGALSPDLLREFAKWFESHSADGYAYSIPTVTHWLMAFVGVTDVDRARDGVREWFQGTDSGRHHFNPEPAVRYGVNKVTGVGSRQENRTPTGLLDMESNVQELVLDGEVFMAIGASNRDSGVKVMLDHCLQPRRYDTDAQTHQGRLTGVRLLRKPQEAR
jgi:hypothetical protein